MIPRRLHLWWNEHPVPDWVLAARDRWRAMHPTWITTLWADEPVPARAVRVASDNQASVVERDRIRHNANLVRWHLLGAFGGVWVDCDTEPVHPLDDLIASKDPFCGSVTLPEATIIGGPMNHPIWQQLIHHSSRHTQPGTAPQLSGSHALRHVLAAHPDVRVLEPGAFFDRDTANTPIPVHGTRYARHAWKTSRRRRAEALRSCLSANAGEVGRG